MRMRMRFLIAMALATLTASASEFNLLENPGFEVGEGESGALGWRLDAPRFSRTPGAGRNGTCALCWDGTKESKRTSTNQRVPIKPGKLYQIEGWVRCEGLDASGHGASIGLDWCDEKGKWIAGEYPVGVKGTEADWQHVSATVPRMPTNAAFASVMFWVENGTKGRAYFDDVRLYELAPKAVPVFVSDCYRDVAWDGEVTFSAALDLKAAGLEAGNLQGRFSVALEDGSRRIYPVKNLSGDRATLTLPVGKLKVGRQLVGFRLTDRDGVKRGEAGLYFTREARQPERHVWIDRHRRTIVDGKPFFPLGFYNGGLSQGQVHKYWKQSPFNCIMPYSQPAVEDMDCAWTNGFMVFVSLKDAYVRTLHCPKEIGSEADEAPFVTSVVEKFRRHPALLAWYVNDELDVGMVPRMAARRNLLEKLDPDHPTWGCIYQIAEAGAYVPSVDVQGSDPYPIPGDIGYVTTATKAVFDAALGQRAVWQTPQIFDWRAYHKPPREGERAPTEDEMRNMSWQCIASGANGLVYYSYHALWLMDKTDPFEKRWADCCRVAGEIREKFPILLSDPSPLRVENAPASLVWRTWRHEGKTWLLIVNRTREPVSADLRLSSGRTLKVNLPAIGSTFVGL